MNFSTIRNPQWLTLVKQTFSEWLDDNALRLSAALAYYSAFSIAPLLVIAIGVAGLLFGAEAARGEINSQLAGTIGPVAAKGVQSLLEGASKPSQGIGATLIGFAILLVGASGVFNELKSAMNTIWQVEPRGNSGWKSFVIQRLLSFSMVLVIGLLLLMSLVLTTTLAALSTYLERMFSIPAFVWMSLNFCASLGIVTLLFAAIFKILPDAVIRWRDVWIGAFVTACLFEFGKFGLGMYLGRESTASSYGAAASVALLLLWLYYSSCILFFGAEFTQVFARTRGRTIVPKAHAKVAESAPPHLRPHSPPKEHISPRDDTRVRNQHASDVRFPATLSAETPGSEAARASGQSDERSLHSTAGPRRKLSRVVDAHPLSAILAVTGLSLLTSLLAKRHGENARHG